MYNNNILDLDNEAFYERMAGLRLQRAWFRPQLEGADRIPDGGALIVSNHGIFGLDLAVLIWAVYQATGRPLRTLGDHVVFSNRFTAKMARSLAIVEGTPEDAETLLKAGELVLVYPGGALEALAAPRDKYRLYWENAYGFARTAIKAGVPVVPLAGYGVDDTYRQLLSREQIKERPFGRWIARTFGEKYIFPFYIGLGPLPFPKKIRYRVGEPVATAGRSSENEQDLLQVHQQAKTRLQTLLNRIIHEDFG